MKKNQPDPVVSVIVPCYEQANYLPDALASVRGQSFADWECLIVDDGSPDETATVARSWTESDNRFRYFEKVNGGLSSARNFGVARARGRYIQFLDADDVILPDKFQRQLCRLGSRPARSLAYCDYRRGDVNNVYAEPDPPATCLPTTLAGKTSLYELVADWETRLSIPAHCFLFNRVFFDEGVRFDECLANHEDWECWVRIFSMAESIEYCSEVLAVYRYSPRSISRRVVPMMEGFLDAIDSLLSRPDLSGDIKAMLRTKRAEMKLSYERKILNQNFLFRSYFKYKRLFGKTNRRP